MVEEIAPQESEHAIAQISGMHVRGTRHNPWHRAEQPSLPDDSGNKRIPNTNRQ